MKDNSLQSNPISHNYITVNITKKLSIIGRRAHRTEHNQICFRTCRYEKMLFFGQYN